MVGLKAFSATIILTACLVYLISLPLTQTGVEDPWLDVAATAWSYFQPGVGVSARTGLNYATSTYHYITDWDLGCYISAVIDAERIGLIGEAEACSRLEKVLSFLKTRELTGDGLPYWFYSSDDGKPVYSKGVGNAPDSGRLLVALHIIKKLKPSMAADVDAVVSRTNYAKFAENCPTEGFYAYYLAHGYSLFGFNTSRVQKALSFIDRVPSMKQVQVYSQSLPVTEVTMEPILHAVFELETASEFQALAYRVYRVQEDRYTETGKPTAFTEGAYPTSPNYIYEWIVHPYGNTWYITTPTWQPMDIPPVVYTKAAFAMHAIWPSSYTEKLVEYVSKARTSGGFYEGVDENGQTVSILTDKTNSLIINAARYAIERATPSPSPSPTPAGGYTLRVRVLDWDMKDPVANATVHLNGDAKASDAEGYAEWGNLTGTATVEVSYLGVKVGGPVSVEMDMNRAVEVQCRFYDVYVHAVWQDGSPAQDIRFTFTLNGVLLGSALTNQTGYAYFQDVPASNLTLAAYGGSDHEVKLGEWAVEVYEDNQIVDPSVGGTEFPPAHVVAAAAAFTVAALTASLKFRLKRR